jgi:hypothetical protein
LFQREEGRHAFELLEDPVADFDQIVSRSQCNRSPMRSERDCPIRQIASLIAIDLVKGILYANDFVDFFTASVGNPIHGHDMTAIWGVSSTGVIFSEPFGENDMPVTGICQPFIVQ